MTAYSLADHDCEHNHSHGNNRDHSCDHDSNQSHPHDDDHNKSQSAKGAPLIQVNQHDEAVVVSCSFDLVVNSRQETCNDIKEKLDAIAKRVVEGGGIIGHIKASVETTATDMLSITDATVQQKSAPALAAHINLVAILFLIGPDSAESLVAEILVEHLALNPRK